MPIPAGLSRPIKLLHLLRYLAVGITLCSISAVATENSRIYRYSDAHLHTVDFFQQGADLSELIAAMDAAGTDHAMVSGMALMKKWQENEPKRPATYAGDDAGVYWFSATDAYLAAAVAQLPAAQRQRLHPFLSGFNPTDKNADQHLEKMVALHPGLWQGIGEVITRHDDLTALTEGEVPRANSEAMFRVYAFAERHDLPVLLHTNITSKRERSPLYVGELEEALERYPNVRFIWAHAGTSKTLHRFQGKMNFLLPEVTRLLARHPNLSIDLSWTVLEDYLLDAEGTPDPAWVALVSRYPDRFMIGSDLLGSYDRLGEKLGAFDAFLDALPDDTSQRIARDNFLAQLPERGARPLTEQTRSESR